ncbi:hypothetical protein GCM10022243_30680 [Saccharothrix violaceirubra]|uniref:TIR domain-containing protein n=1 Tax=Saccharothrix violaceirubra TaxID=413306 RepID=A0A7W7WWS3_9PSEU|nr:toll/interleukin-1 receptor domain-containing protein [Saccharothrix violaceirubra]MBB4966694.1 hypothetical protein [Saccharothrix violaceirubra]
MNSTIRVFLSYARADDAVLDFIDPFVASLAHVAFADRGRRVEVFVDRADLGWGRDWQRGIGEAIERATVFLPVVTRQYFDRPPCREELLTFHAEARRRGVEGLMLPVVVLGHSYVSEDSEDVVARLIAARQFRDVRDAWADGVGSAAWRRTLLRLAGDLVDAVEAAERALAARPGPVPEPADDLLTEDLLTEDLLTGTVELMRMLTEEIPGLLESLRPDIARFGRAEGEVAGLGVLPAASVRVRRLEIAEDLRPAAARFEERARLFEAWAARAVVVMRRQGLGTTSIPARDEGALAGTLLVRVRRLEQDSPVIGEAVRGFRVGATALVAAFESLDLLR